MRLSCQLGSTHTLPHTRDLQKVCLAFGAQQPAPARRALLGKMAEPRPTTSNPGPAFQRSQPGTTFRVQTRTRALLRIHPWPIFFCRFELGSSGKGIVCLNLSSEPDYVCEVDCALPLSHVSHSMTPKSSGLAMYARC